MSATARQQQEREYPMQIRDSDLRQAIHAHGAPPGTPLWRLLRELQERRDRDDEETRS